jgi:hypothetical protein
LFRRSVFLGFILFAACGNAERVATAPRVTAVGPIFRAVSPLGTAGTFVAIYVTLADNENTPTNLLVELSRDNGASFTAIGTGDTGAMAVGGDGTSSLTAMFSGSLHRLLWSVPDSIDLDAMLVLRFTPSEVAAVQPPFPGFTGTPVLSAPFSLASLSPESR